MYKALLNVLFNNAQMIAVYIPLRVYGSPHKNTLECRTQHLIKNTKSYNSPNPSPAGYYHLNPSMLTSNSSKFM